jgi:plasmid maintenance system killer protein
MEVFFANSKLQNLCNSAKKLKGEYGPRMAEIIKQRLIELSNAETLEVMRSISGSHCHELSQNLKGLLAVNLIHPNRLAFKPANKPIPRKPDGGLDWKQVTSIEIVGIGDYHQN